jgi:uncharacterized protein
MEKKILKRTFVDTGFVVALINEKDEYHDKAIELSIEFERKPVLITDSILLEIGNSLSRSHRESAISAIERFLTTEETEVVRLDETLFNKAFELYKSHSDKTWGLVDCVSFVVMKENGITDALTCDRHYVQAGFRALMLDTVN